MWPKGGFKAVKRASSEMWKRVKILFKKDNEPNLKTLYKYQLFIILKLFSEVPFRNLFPTFKIKKSIGNNYIARPKSGNWTLIVNQHKTVKKHGPKEVKLSRSSTMALRKFLVYRAQVGISHEFLLSNKNGSKLTKSAMGKALHRITGELLGKRFGSRLIRILAATSEKNAIERVEDLQNRLLHGEGSKQTKQYTR